jgi:hypothetical protein
MSRVYAPVAVGNDFVVTVNKKIPKTNQPNMQVTSLLAQPVAETVRPAPVLSQPLPAGNSPFLSAAPASSSPTFLTGPRVGLVVAAVALLCVITSGYAYRGRVMSVISDVKYATKQLALDIPENKSDAQPVTDSQQVTVSSSSLELAISGLISQPVSIRIGSSAISPSQANIMSWLNLAKHGSQTTISVNNSQLEAYLKQLVASNSHPATNRVILNRGWGLPIVETEGQNGVSVQYSQSTYNQLANNLLKAKGLSLSLATTVSSYKTVVTGSQKVN